MSCFFLLPLLFRTDRLDEHRLSEMTNTRTGMTPQTTFLLNRRLPKPTVNLSKSIVLPELIFKILFLRESD